LEKNSQKFFDLPNLEKDEALQGNLLTVKNGIESRRGAPFGAAALITKGVWGHQPPSHIF